MSDSGITTASNMQLTVDVNDDSSTVHETSISSIGLSSKNARMSTFFKLLSTTNGIVKDSFFIFGSTASKTSVSSDFDFSGSVKNKS